MTFRETVKAYAELVRLPNVFTAWADIMAAWSIYHADATSFDDSSAIYLADRTLHLLLLATTCFYWGGMILNDVFDHRDDSLHRPQRPIPSGRVPLRIAAALGWLLLGLGLALVYAASYRGETPWAGIILPLMIVAYDAGLKRTAVGFLAMGACRSFNVLLVPAVSVSSNIIHLSAFAVLSGCYFAGITLAAKTESQSTSRLRLSSGFAVIVLALGGLSVLTLGTGQAGRVWRYAALGLLLTTAAVLAWRFALACARPDLQRVQAFVKLAILANIVIACAAATAFIGPLGMGLLVLLPPALFLGRWIYST